MEYFSRTLLSAPSVAARVARLPDCYSQCHLVITSVKRTCATSLLLLLGALPAFAGQMQVAWPPGWDVQALPSPEGTGVTRERAVRADANGDPEMIVELTQTPLEAGHAVNLEAVVLQMRKVTQVNLQRQGYQSACTPVKAGTLGRQASAQTTCEIVLNGGHVMTQTLVAASGEDTAWSLSYAGTVAGYAAHQAEVDGIRNSLVLGTPP